MKYKPLNTYTHKHTALPSFFYFSFSVSTVFISSQRIVCLLSKRPIIRIQKNKAKYFGLRRMFRSNEREFSIIVIDLEFVHSFNFTSHPSSLLSSIFVDPSRHHRHHRLYHNNDHVSVIKEQYLLSFCKGLHP